MTLLLLLLQTSLPLPVEDAGAAPHGRLYPAESVPFDEVQFGRAVAVDGDRLVVGEPDVQLPGLQKGRAVFFERGTDGRWQPTFEFFQPQAPDDQGGRIGWSVDLQGDRALIGHPEATEPGPVYGAGRAWVLERQPDASWAVTDVLRPTILPLGIAVRFGTDVALDGDQLVVGTASWESYVYRLGSDGAFALEAVLDTSAAAGVDLDLEGDDLVVGERHWRRDPGGWVALGPVLGLPPSGAWNPAVALEGGRLALGSEWDPTFGWKTGAVHLFERDPQGRFVFTGTLYAPDPRPGDAFGFALAFGGTSLWVSALRDDDGGDETGTAWRFREDPAGWTADARATGNQPAVDFGFVLDADASTLLVGAPLESTPSDSSLYGQPSGAAHVFDLAPLVGTPGAVAAATGGVQSIALDAGPVNAGLPYLVLGGASGALGVLDPHGLAQLPFVVDSYTQAMLLGAGAGPWPGCTGLTDPEGRATAALVVPPLPPSAVGLTVHHAALVLDTDGSWPLVTQPIGLSVTP